MSDTEEVSVPPKMTDQGDDPPPNSGNSGNSSKRFLEGWNTAVCIYIFIIITYNPVKIDAKKTYGTYSQFPDKNIN